MISKSAFIVTLNQKRTHTINNNIILMDFQKYLMDLNIGMM